MPRCGPASRHNVVLTRVKRTPVRAVNNIVLTRVKRTPVRAVKRTPVRAVEGGDGEGGDGEGGEGRAVTLRRDGTVQLSPKP